MGRYLIDTNIFIEMNRDPALLSRDIWAVLSDYENQIFISVESLKELVHMYNTKQWMHKIWPSKRQMIASVSELFQIQSLPVTTDVVEKYADMFINTFQHHNDPSDHIIVAQALLMNLTLISDDNKFSYYRNQGLQLIENE